MSTPEDAKAKAAATYNAASDHYDDAANSFWGRFGRRTVERLNLSPGARVLDVCCGSGASAIPAAEAVGAQGLVIGVDLAEHLLELARRKAGHRGLNQVAFRTGDLLDLGLPEAGFDAVVCVFGIFSWREVFEYERFWSIGSGSEYALGAMYAAYDNNDDSEAIARLGIEASCEFDTASGLPCSLHTMKMMKVR